MRDSLRKAKLRKQEAVITKQKAAAALIVAADSIGAKIQYNCPGFLANRRQVILFILPGAFISYGIFYNPSFFFCHFLTKGCIDPNDTPSNLIFL